MVSSFIIDTFLLRAGKNRFTIELKPDAVGLAEDQVQLIAPVQINLTIEKIEAELIFTGDYKTYGRFECHCCLSQFDQPLEETFELCLRPERTAYPKELELSEDDTLEYTYTGKEIDFCLYLREMIILALPIKHLCQKDCKGLCPHCGQNLNETNCSCKSPTHDPRWEKLKQLK